MSVDLTENDAEIARILSEEYERELTSFDSKSSKSCSPIPSKKMKLDDESEKLDKFSLKSVYKNSSQCTNENYLQIDEDGEMALILQIEEIVLSENHINKQTTEATDVQLEKTHTDMTKALQPIEKTDLMTRIIGMFVTIQTRYVNCQAKNQILIDQIQKLSVQFYPSLIAFKTQGISSITKAAVPSLALGLITNVLQGKLEINDAKQTMFNLLQIWNDSSVWYEFFEQLVYILVAITVPSFAQGAMGKIMAKFSPIK